NVAGVNVLLVEIPRGGSGRVSCAEGESGLVELAGEVHGALLVTGGDVEIVGEDGAGDLRSVDGRGDRLEELLGAGSHGDGEAIAGDEVRGAVGDGELHLVVEGDAHVRGADEHAVRILDAEHADIGTGL